MINQTNSNIPSPCFLIHECTMRANLEKLCYVQKKAKVKIVLALKGFANFQMFSMIRKYLQGIAASSLSEALLGQEYFGGEIHTYSPAYYPQDFSTLAALSNHLTFNSLSQWERYSDELAAMPNPPSIGLRINPEHSEVTTDLYNPSAQTSRLGVRPGTLKTLPQGIDGLHFHNLCEGNSDALMRTLSAVENKFGHLFDKVKWLNMGGGHLITAREYNIDHLISLLHGFKCRYPWIELILEPGSAIAWQSGCLVTTVLDIIDCDGKTFALIDASIAAHMPDCLEMPYRPVIRGASDPVRAKPTYFIGGNTCLAGDYLTEYSFDEPLKVGDKIIFEDMIHYTMVKTTMFNGVQHPAIGVISSEGKFKLLKEFSYIDYKQHLG